MNIRNTLIQEAEELLRRIERERQADLGSSVCWFGAEGERVRDNANEFLHALRTGTEKDFLNGRQIDEYLGRDWVNSHSSVYQQVFAIAKILREFV